MSKASALRALLDGQRIVRVVGARDGLSAKLVDEAGFDAVWASSFEISATRHRSDSAAALEESIVSMGDVFALQNMPAAYRTSS